MADKNMLEAIEAAALNAWTAPCQMEYDGWLLRITGGESKRVNSVNIRGKSSFRLDQKIAACEEIYQRFDQPCLFRLPEIFSSQSLIQAFSDAGYAAFDPTHVLGRVIPLSWEFPDGVMVRDLNMPDWLEVRSRVSGTSLAGLAYHARVLGAILPEKVLMGLFVRDQPVACGMGVLEGNLLGYFSIYTHKAWRRQGCAGAVMGALSQWGQRRGADFGYLQVEGHNLPALQLYKQLGFERIYSYSYWKRG